MTQLGIVVTTNEAPSTGGISPSTGTAFFVGQADQGPVSSATLVQSLSNYVAVYGPRTSVSALLYDAVQTFFEEDGSQCYIAREEGSGMVSSPATYTASLTLNDQGTHPSVVASYATPGAAGNSYQVAVTTSTGPTFTATTATSTALTAISSLANIGVGTLVTGSGIPANTYIVSINAGASSAVLSAATTATATNVTVTPGTFTVAVEDVGGSVLATHGPFINTAALYADSPDGYVVFSQSAGGSFTVYSPATLSATFLTGGSDDTSDVSDNTVAVALTLFLPSYGPGQVAVPGQTDSAIHTSLATHAFANNRIALLDLADASTPTTVIAALGAAPVDPSYCIITEGSGIIPGVVTGTTRTVAASAIVAALCSRVDATGNPNQAPAGTDWALQYVTGFSENFKLSDIQTLNNAGINSFATVNGVLCLFGFSTPITAASDPIFWQASHSRLRMYLVQLFKQTAAPYMFKQIDGNGVLLGALGGKLASELQPLYKAGALFGSTANDAFRVNVDSSVNPLSQLALGIISAAVAVHMSPFAQEVTLVLSSVPITQSF